MCGITGIALHNPREVLGEHAGVRMMDALRHRGPDDSGCWQGDAAFLGHLRLSIIDIGEGGKQPFFSEQRHIIAIFNGEIYNHHELRHALEQRGHRFFGRSDGEIIPHLYQEHGPEFVSMLQGMFAIAVYDTRKQRLLLARDRIGIKPLYYAVTPRELVFGSEIKALLCCPAVSRRMDPQAVRDYLALSFIPEPSTGYAGIEMLPPGHVLVSEAGTRTLTEYWSYTPGRNPSETAARGALKTTLERTVERQLMADVPLGVLLSGGIDSSLVTSVASTVSAFKIQSFTVQFGEKSYDESGYARTVAEALGTEHNVLPLATGTASAGEIERILTHFDQPFGDSSAIPTYHISAEMRKHVKVALSGDGGDELFYGYPIFSFLARILRVRPMLALVPAAVTRSLTHVVRERSVMYRYIRRAATYGSKSRDAIFADMRSYLSETELAVALSPAGRDFFAETDQTLRLFAPYAPLLSTRPKDAVSKWLVRYSLTGDMLRKVDMMSMLAGLEVRVPLLDETLVEMAEMLPASAKHRGNVGKLPLRHLLEQYLPAEITSRKKQGFAIPFDAYAGPEVRGWVESLLTGKDSSVAHLFERAWLTRLLGAFQQGRGSSGDMSRYKTYQLVYMLLSLELWMRRNAFAVA